MECSYTHHNFTIHSTSPAAVPCLPREHVRTTLALYHRHFITARSPHNHSHRHHTLAHHARTAPLYLSLCTISLHCCINLPRGWCRGMNAARQPHSCLGEKSRYLLLPHSFIMGKKQSIGKKKEEGCIYVLYLWLHFRITSNFRNDQTYNFLYKFFVYVWCSLFNLGIYCINVESSCNCFITLL